MKRFQNIVLLVLIALVGNAFGQKTDWEKEDLQGKVKKYEKYTYEFDISDSIDHEDFIKRFYLCDFVVDRMIRFADSIKSEKDTKGVYVHEYDSLEYLVKILLNKGNEIRFQNEFDNQSRVLRRIRAFDNVPEDSVFFTYDDFGRLLEERYWSNVLGYRTTQWMYDSEGRLLEEKELEGDTIQSYFRKVYDKKGVLRKSERFGFPHSNTKIYCEYDSKGNVVFERRENTGLEDVIERRIKYKYDRNDSIIKEKCRATQWRHTDIRSEGDRWQETDSTGQVVDYVNYKITRINDKKKWKEERIVTRNAEGFPIKERYVQKNSFGKTVSLSDYDNFGRMTKYEEFHNDDPVPCVVIKYKYDELGREVEKERIDHRFSQFRKEEWRYHKDTNYYSYYATYDGENFDFSHESLFFFDDQGNCIAHIQWMPKTQNWEYYFNVYRYEYYE